MGRRSQQVKDPLTDSPMVAASNIVEPQEVPNFQVWQQLPCSGRFHQILLPGKYLALVVALRVAWLPLQMKISRPWSRRKTNLKEKARRGEEICFSIGTAADLAFRLQKNLLKFYLDGFQGRLKSWTSKFRSYPGVESSQLFFPPQSSMWLDPKCDCFGLGGIRGALKGAHLPLLLAVLVENQCVLQITAVDPDMWQGGHCHKAQRKV